MTEWGRASERGGGGLTMMPLPLTCRAGGKAPKRSMRNQGPRVSARVHVRV